MFLQRLNQAGYWLQLVYNTINVPKLICRFLAEEVGTVAE